MLRLCLTSPSSASITIEAPNTQTTYVVDAFTISHPADALVNLVTKQPTKIVLEVFPDVQNSPSISVTEDDIVFSSYEHLGRVTTRITRTPSANQELVDWLTAYINLKA